MKVLFVASGNKIVGTVSAFISSQYESLKQEGVEMSLFAVKGHGFKGYLKNVALLRSLIKQDKPDVVHAHYSVCGYLSSIASLGLKTKVVVSILGSFPKKKFKLYFVRFCIDHVWNTTIVKSERTRNQLRRTIPVVPNGVNLSQFELINYDEARRQLGLEPGMKYVIFVSNPSRPEKNFSLAELAVKALNDNTVKLIPVFDKPHCEVVKYMCAGVSKNFSNPVARTNGVGRHKRYICLTSSGISIHRSVVFNSCSDAAFEKIGYKSSAFNGSLVTG